MAVCSMVHRNLWCLHTKSCEAQGSVLLAFSPSRKMNSLMRAPQQST